MEIRKSRSLQRLARNRSLAVVVAAAMTLAACANYRATIAEPGGDGQSGAASRSEVVAPEGAAIAKDAVIVRPKLKENERALTGDLDIDDPWGSVRLRFDVSKDGKAGNVRVIEATNSEVTEAARHLIAAWPIEPGTLDGKPAAFKNVEATISFEKVEMDSDQKAALKVVGVILLIPVIVVLAAAAVLSGAKFNR